MLIHLSSSAFCVSSDRFYQPLLEICRGQWAGEAGIAAWTVPPAGPRARARRPQPPGPLAAPPGLLVVRPCNPSSGEPGARGSWGSWDSAPQLCVEPAPTEPAWGSRRSQGYQVLSGGADLAQTSRDGRWDSACERHLQFRSDILRDSVSFL